MREAALEVQRGFSLVGLVQGENAEKYIRFFQQLPASDVSMAAQALVTRMNEPVLLGKATVLSGLQAAYVRAYLQFEEFTGPGGTRILKAEQSRATWTVELRKTLRGLVKKRFLAMPGALEFLSTNEWVHDVNIDSIRVSTWLDFGGRSAMSYSHRLSINEGARLNAQLSLLQWLGAASMTRWRVLRAEELIGAAEAVFVLSQHFIKEMSMLFGR
ncbi:MAG: hypothetical protein WAK20_09030 [Candidatus Acidiferrum sp.]